MRPSAALRAVVAVIYLFIFAPIVITAAVSFNAAPQSKFPPVGFSLRWWAEALDPRWLEPLQLSVELAFTAAIIATLLGLPMAWALVRERFPGRDAIAALVLGPLVLPALVTGIALLQILQVVGLGSLVGFPALVIGHVIICLPFTVRTIGISLRAMPVRAELAAASLSAHPAQVFRLITLPLIKTGMFAGGVFAFIQSFTDYSISLFLANAGIKPISVTILGFLEFGFTPTLAAVAVLTLVVPLVLLLAVQRVFRVGDFIYGAGSRG